jgi:glyoxylase-like metal-dependent hydrolase (beta-lactamase superfamily II)
MKKIIIFGVTLLIHGLLSSLLFAQDFSKVTIKVIKASNQVYMLQGSGGNIGVLATSEGLLLVDDQFAPLAERIEAALKRIENKSLKYIVNTHFHGDHTGSNDFFAHKAPIFAHYNVRERLAKKELTERVALPVVTYENGVKIFLEQEEIQLSHFPNAHTDGDTVVYFKKANVLHTGDLFFELGFPYIDLNNGGSVKGYLAAVDQLIRQMPDDVVIIPGHGKLTNKKRFKAFAQMIRYSVDRVSQLIAQGKSEQEILRLGIGSDYTKWSWQFINEEKWLKTLIKDLQPNG